MSDVLMIPPWFAQKLRDEFRDQAQEARELESALAAGFSAVGKFLFLNSPPSIRAALAVALERLDNASSADVRLALEKQIRRIRLYRRWLQFVVEANRDLRH